MDDPTFRLKDLSTGNKLFLLFRMIELQEIVEKFKNYYNNSYLEFSHKVYPQKHATGNPVEVRIQRGEHEIVVTRVDL